MCCRLGFNLGHAKVTYHEESSLLSTLTERATECRSTELLINTVGIAAWLRPVHNTTTYVVGCATRTLAGAAGAFLAIRLSTTTRDLTASLSTSGACSTASELPFDDLIKEVFSDFGVEDLVTDFDLTYLVTFKVNDC